MRLWFLLAPFVALLGVWVMTVLTAALVSRSTCGYCLHAHPLSRPCVPPSWEDRVRLRNQQIEMERRETLNEDRLL